LPGHVRIIVITKCQGTKILPSAVQGILLFEEEFSESRVELRAIIAEGSGYIAQKLRPRGFPAGHSLGGIVPQ
jgi:hypothetical protein